MITGLLTPDEGEGTCLGYDIRTQADEIKRHVGYMTQRFSLYQDLSVRENLEFVARLYGIDNPVAAARAMIERLGLKGREEQLAGELSGGWKQRLALGACTLPNPQLLLLDEPTAGIDATATQAIMELLRRLHEQRRLTILMVNHDLAAVRKAVQEVIWLHQGKVLYGPVTDLLSREKIEEIMELEIR
jgi:ABC-2 type transport system ATP-binding protein